MKEEERRKNEHRLKKRVLNKKRFSLEQLVLVDVIANQHADVVQGAE
jgi:hypothetical protein